MALYLHHKEDIDAALNRALTGGRYILGPETARFEEEFAAYLGVKHAIGVGSGTDALHLGLIAMDVRPKDEILTVSHTAVATVSAIEQAGAVPVFVDIDPDTFLVDISRLQETIHKKKAEGAPLKGIVAVHLYGQMIDMPALMQLAEQDRLFVLEDCAQAHGAEWHTEEGKRKAGSFGHLSAFSFYPTKNLGALGDGGAVATNDPAIAQRLRWLREYGWKERYVSHMAGFNSRLDEIQAAILRVKLRSLDVENERRRFLAAIYDRSLPEPVVKTPKVQSSAYHVYHQYVVRTATKDRDPLMEFLKGKGIGSLIHYPLPVHRQPAYCSRLDTGVDLCHTEQTVRQILSLPMHPLLKDEEVLEIARLIDLYLHTISRS
jgi:dTDP-4-amino-4,6-dideoxygalactose transaminase